MRLWSSARAGRRTARGREGPSSRRWPPQSPPQPRHDPGADEAEAGPEEGGVEEPEPVEPDRDVGDPNRHIQRNGFGGRPQKAGRLPTSLPGDGDAPTRATGATAAG